MIRWLIPLLLCTTPVWACPFDPGELCDDFCAPHARLGCILPSPSLDVVGYDYEIRDANETDWRIPTLSAPGRVGVTVPLGALFNHELGRKFIRIRARDAAGNTSPWLVSTFRNAFSLNMRNVDVPPPPPPPPPTQEFTLEQVQLFVPTWETAAVVTKPFTVGSHLYTDRQYIVTSLPEHLVNAVQLQLPNNLKSRIDNPFGAFDVPQPAEVCIGFDQRFGSNLPGWLSVYQKQVGEIIETNDSDFQVYCRLVPISRVTVGPNRDVALGNANSLYLIIVQPQGFFTDSQNN